MLVGLPQFAFEGRWDAGENQPATLAHSLNENRRHLNQGSGEHIGDYKGPIALHNLGAAMDEGSRLSVEEAIALAQRGRGARRRPSTGWGSLTPTESQVVELVAEGLSNPAIAARLLISRKTVTTHLGHVFAKLGVSSRAELAARAVRRTNGGTA